MREYARQLSLNSTFNAHETLVTWSKVIKGDFDVANRHLTMRHAHSYEGQVCMCVSAACVYIHVCVCMCVCVRVGMRVCLQVCITHLQVCITQVIHSPTHSHTHTHMHIQVSDAFAKVHADLKAEKEVRLREKETYERERAQDELRWQQQEAAMRQQEASMRRQEAMMQKLLDSLSPATPVVQPTLTAPVASNNSLSTSSTTVSSAQPPPTTAQDLTLNESAHPAAALVLIPMAKYQSDLTHPKNWTGFDIFKECLKYSGVPSSWRRKDMRADTARVEQWYHIFTLLSTPHEKKILLAVDQDGLQDQIKGHLNRNFIRVWNRIFVNKNLKVPPSIRCSDTNFKWPLSLSWTACQNKVTALIDAAKDAKQERPNLATPWTSNPMILAAVKEVLDKFPSPVKESDADPPLKKRKAGNGGVATD
jgi:hypothetical protein